MDYEIQDIEIFEELDDRELDNYSGAGPWTSGFLSALGSAFGGGAGYYVSGGDPFASSFGSGLGASVGGAVGTKGGT